MTLERARIPESLTAVEAGEVLSLPADVVRALADAGYLRASEVVGGVPRFATGELKGFQARAAEAAGGTRSWSDPFDGIDADELVAALEGRAEQIAERALELVARIHAPAASYDDTQRALFLGEARTRIEGIIALCARGPSAAGVAFEDEEEALAGIGADAAGVGIPLSLMLLALRVSRDLVVQTAIELAEERGRHWGLALAVVLTRALPSVDRLTDAVARGYWEAVLEIEAESIDRFRNLVEHATDGVFELDERDIVRFANPAFAALVGRAQSALPGTPLADLPLDGLVVHRLERVRDGVVVGWDCVTRPA